VSLTAAIRPPATRIAITSGKGGVGKTSLAINVAVALARLGHQVGLVDADLALGNVDVLLGLTPTQHLGSVIDGDRRVTDVMLDGPAGIRVIPAASGVRSLSALDAPRWQRFATAIADAGRDLDFLVLDTATGLTTNVLDVAQLADYVLVVTSHDPAAVVDGYAVIKALTAVDREKPIGVVVNGAADADQGALVFRQVSLAAEKFLGRSLRYDGHVLEDPSMREAALAQVPLVAHEQGGPASRCIRRIACRLAGARPSGTGPWGTAATAGLSRAGAEAPRCA
jgi:flagellar biosynthesis protein FlhG